jgi:hypothetical protein
VRPSVPLTARAFERRETLRQAVDGLARRVEGNDQITTPDEFHKRAADMILSPQAPQAFDIAAEGDHLRDR